MKLYLSSNRVPNTEALLSLVDNTSSSVAIIPNAWDVYPTERKAASLDETKKVFLDMGFKINTIDLRKIQGGKLLEVLAKNNLIWITGGNTFYLNELVRESGLDKILTDIKNDIIYGGESAGAIMAGKTLHGIEYLDDPKKASGINWDGLGLVDFSIVPHWGSEKYSEGLSRCKQEMSKFSAIKTISDSQSLVINDDKVQIIGK